MLLPCDKQTQHSCFHLPCLVRAKYCTDRCKSVHSAGLVAIAETTMHEQEAEREMRSNWECLCYYLPQQDKKLQQTS